MKDNYSIRWRNLHHLNEKLLYIISVTVDSLTFPSWLQLVQNAGKAFRYEQKQSRPLNFCNSPFLFAGITKTKGLHHSRLIRMIKNIKASLSRNLKMGKQQLTISTARVCHFFSHSCSTCHSPMVSLEADVSFEVL